MRRANEGSSPNYESIRRLAKRLLVRDFSQLSHFLSLNFLSGPIGQKMN